MKVSIIGEIMPTTKYFLKIDILSKSFSIEILKYLDISENITPLIIAKSK